MRNMLDHLPPRFASAIAKLSLGVRVVGLGATVRGGMRLARLAVLRPPMATVELRSGGHLAFEYPEQFAPSLVMFGDLIDPEFSFLRAIARPNWTVVDVGAAIGQFSVFAGLLPCARILAFEPSEQNLRVLERNIRENRLDALVSIQATALADTTGEASFCTSTRTYLSGLTRPGASAGAHSVVSVRRLDDELDRLDVAHVDVLKINVAGAEPEVLDGATRLLSQAHADIVVLLLGTRSLQWYERLHELGYELGFYHPVESRLTFSDTIDARIFSTAAWPSRHLIAVSRAAIDRGALTSIRSVEWTTRG